METVRLSMHFLKLKAVLIFSNIHGNKKVFHDILTQAQQNENIELLKIVVLMYFHSQDQFNLICRETEARWYLAIMCTLLP